MLECSELLVYCCRDGLRELFYGVYQKDSNKCLDALETMGVLVGGDRTAVKRTADFFLEARPLLLPVMNCVLSQHLRLGEAAGFMTALLGSRKCPALHVATCGAPLVAVGAWLASNAAHACR